MFYEMFLLSLVNYSYSFSTTFLELFLIVATISLVVVMLNLLIAIIGDSYAYVQQNKDTLNYRQQIVMIEDI